MLFFCRSSVVLCAQYGRRVIYLFAVGIFCIGSALSGAATSIWFLVCLLSLCFLCLLVVTFG